MFKTASHIMAAIVFSCMALLAPAEELEYLVNDAQLFDLTQDSFVAKYGKLGGKFTSDARDSYRIAYADVGANQQLVKIKHTYMGINCSEMLFSFNKEGKLSELRFSLYNRGDAESAGGMGTGRDYPLLKLDDFSQLVTRVHTEMSTKLGAKPRITKDAGAAKEDIYYWFIKETQRAWRLDASLTDDRRTKTKQAEYLFFVLEDRRGKSAALTSTEPKKVSAAAAKKNVQKDENGDVWVKDVPMVDQGMKGYCACATTARLLQYFGRNADQHEISQISGAGDQGTNPDQLIAALKKIRTKMDISLKDLYDMETDRDLPRAAQKWCKANGKPIPFGTGWNLFGGLTYDDAKTIRCSCKTFEKFKADVKTHIDQGIPLGWALMLGMYPEEGKVPQNGGGHMRTIIGYNLASNDLIFSDSWGAGHEKKKMKMNDAFAATMMLLRIEPK